jgi:hypothetical protein
MKKLSATLMFMALAACVRADEVGEVSTAFILIGANHKVVVEAYDDPKVTRDKKKGQRASGLEIVVETKGIEPSTSALRTPRSPS